MNKILSFIKLDLRLIKPYWKSLVILLGLALLMGFVFKSSGTLSTYLMMMLLLIMSYPFAVTDKNNLDILYGTLSVSRKTVVVGRYAFVLVIILACDILSFFCAWIFSAIIKEPISPSQLLFISCISFAVVAFAVALQYPIYFKLGYTKAKVLALIPMFLIFIIFLLIPTLADLMDFNFSLTDILNSATKYPGLLSLAAIACGLLFFGTSCYISYKIYAKRDI